MPTTLRNTDILFNDGTTQSTAASTGAFTNISYTGTLTGGTGVVNLGSGQFVKDASGNVSIGGTVAATDLTRGGSQVYSRNNILGTVSQSSGVPTGAIIERGSNANGVFVRFADGTQIVTRTVTQTSGDNAGTNVSYAATFVDTPRISAITDSIASGGLGASFATETGAIGTGTVTVKSLLHTATTIINPANPTTIIVLLVGRWF